MPIETEIAMLETNFLNTGASWRSTLGHEFAKPYLKELSVDLQKKYSASPQSPQFCPVYPKVEDIFSAFTYTPLDKIKVVILGQDPYHGPGQAHGLSFSVQQGVDIPPSLRNVFKELKADLGINPPNHGNLLSWAKEGVLLLNAVLTVEEGKPGSHAKLGWETFTDAVLAQIDKNCNHVVFILWGSYAQKKAEKIDIKKHLIISSVHPSPLSAHRGFFGSKPFSKASDFLNAHGIEPPCWEIPSVLPKQKSLFVADHH